MALLTESDVENVISLALGDSRTQLFSVYVPMEHAAAVMSPAAAMQDGVARLERLAMDPTTWSSVPEAVLVLYDFEVVRARMPRDELAALDLPSVLVSILAPASELAPGLLEQPVVAALRLLAAGAACVLLADRTVWPATVVSAVLGDLVQPVQTWSLRKGGETLTRAIVDALRLPWSSAPPPVQGGPVHVPTDQLALGFSLVLDTLAKLPAAAAAAGIVRVVQLVGLRNALVRAWVLAGVRAARMDASVAVQLCGLVGRDTDVDGIDVPGAGSAADVDVVRASASRIDALLASGDWRAAVCVHPTLCVVVLAARMGASAGVERMRRLAAARDDEVVEPMADTLTLDEELFAACVRGAVSAAADRARLLLGVALSLLVDTVFPRVPPASASADWERLLARPCAVVAAGWLRVFGQVLPASVESVAVHEQELIHLSAWFDACCTAHVPLQYELPRVLFVARTTAELRFVSPCSLVARCAALVAADGAVSRIADACVLVRVLCAAVGAVSAGGATRAECAHAVDVVLPLLLAGVPALRAASDRGAARLDAVGCALSVLLGRVCALRMPQDFSHVLSEEAVSVLVVLSVRHADVLPRSVCLAVLRDALWRACVACFNRQAFPYRSVELLPAVLRLARDHRYLVPASAERSVGKMTVVQWSWSAHVLAALLCLGDPSTFASAACSQAGRELAVLLFALLSGRMDGAVTPASDAADALVLDEAFTPADGADELYRSSIAFSADGMDRGSDSHASLSSTDRRDSRACVGLPQRELAVVARAEDAAVRGPQRDVVTFLRLCTEALGPVSAPSPMRQALLAHSGVQRLVLSTADVSPVARLAWLDVALGLLVECADPRSWSDETFIRAVACASSCSALSACAQAISTRVAAAASSSESDAQRLLQPVYERMDFSGKWNMMHASLGLNGANGTAVQHAPRRALLESLLRCVVRASDRARLIAELGVGDEAAAMLRAAQGARPLACIVPLEHSSALLGNVDDGDDAPSATSLVRFSLYLDDDRDGGRRECTSPMDTSIGDDARSAVDVLASLESWLQHEQAKVASHLAGVRGDGAKRRAAALVEPRSWPFDELADADGPSKAARLVKTEAAFMEEDADVVVGHGAAALRLAAPLLGMVESGAWGDASVGANGDAAPPSKPGLHLVVFVFRSLWELALADGADVDWLARAATALVSDEACGAAGLAAGVLVVCALASLVRVRGVAPVQRGLGADGAATVLRPFLAALGRGGATLPVQLQHALWRACEQLAEHGAALFASAAALAVVVESLEWTWPCVAVLVRRGTCQLTAAQQAQLEQIGRHADPAWRIDSAQRMRDLAHALLHLSGGAGAGSVATVDVPPARLLESFVEALDSVAVCAEPLASTASGGRAVAVMLAEAWCGMYRARHAPLLASCARECAVRVARLGPAQCGAVLRTVLANVHEAGAPGDDLCMLFETLQSVRCVAERPSA